jgi:iron complex outermembrane receptor protein
MLGVSKMKTKLSVAIASLLAIPFSVVAEEAVYTLSPVEVNAKSVNKQDKEIISKILKTADTAAALSDEPGVNLYTGGGVSSLPVIHGLNDERVKVVVDGMQITAACVNHMNPSLSYVNAANVENMTVMAGITPVSAGGDSIAGTISVNSITPVFASGNEDIHLSGRVSSFFRSNANALHSTVSAAVANKNFSLGYDGSLSSADSYNDGRGNRVRSTQYESMNHSITLAAQGYNQTVIVKAGQQAIPHQGFVNQPMDMVGNRANFVNVNHKGDFDWGKVESRFYWQNTTHEMGFFSAEKTGMMPMNTEGSNLGYAVKAEIPFMDKHKLRVGNEMHNFKLNDWWPAVIGNMMMGDNTFINIKDGKRDRYAVFGEIESKWDSHWSTLLGLRYELVKTNAGNVQPYNTGMMNAPDVAASKAFNAQPHARTDHNFDVTALARYDVNENGAFEFGYARKTRSPSLYERYTWGRTGMDMMMNGFYGDANGYVGNINLKPEIAHTLSATISLQDGKDKNWEAKLTPYFTHVEGYIGVIPTTDGLSASTQANMGGAAGANIALLQHANQNAELYGVDFPWRVNVMDNQYGRAQVKGLVGYVHGKIKNTGNSMYHIMPLNAKIGVEHSLGGWSSGVDVQLVDRKTQVDSLRLVHHTED